MLAGPLYVDYFCYGTNLSETRFSTYLLGGRTRYVDMEYQSVASQVSLDSRPLAVPLTLYFALQAPHWQRSGAAFLDPKPVTDGSQTLGRIYRLQREHFEAVVARENFLHPSNRLQVNYRQLQQQGQVELTTTPYGRLLLIDGSGDYPVITFTAPWDLDAEVREDHSTVTAAEFQHTRYHLLDRPLVPFLNPVGGGYAATMIDGLCETTRASRLKQRLATSTSGRVLRASAASRSF